MQRSWQKFSERQSQHRLADSGRTDKDEIAGPRLRDQIADKSFRPVQSDEVFEFSRLVTLV
jgi:hypothetical protein